MISTFKQIEELFKEIDEKLKSVINHKIGSLKKFLNKFKTEIQAAKLQVVKGNFASLFQIAKGYNIVYNTPAYESYAYY